MDSCFPGSSAITGPKAVSGLEGDSLTVKCQYSPGWETHEKWWCRGAAWSSCKFVVKTTEPEKEVKNGRVSIRDNRKSRTIAVTMEKLRLNDADTYWCGIERFGTDLGVRVKVTINPGKRMCMCRCVSSGAALSWSLGSLFSDLSLRVNRHRGGGVLRSHGTHTDHLGLGGARLPLEALMAPRASSRMGQAFLDTLFFPVPESITHGDQGDGLTRRP